MNTWAKYALDKLRNAGATCSTRTVYPSEATRFVEHYDHLEATNERLQKENAYLKACVPPTKPSDYGHEAWAEALREAVAAERRAVVAFLNSRSAAGGFDSDPAGALADDIERGDHLNIQETSP